MPIIIKDIEWQETESILTIKVPSRGTHSSQVDIFYSRKYIKASYAQYFFEVFLLHEIDVSRSACTLTDSHIIFELIKCESILWKTLELNIDKAEKNRLKKIYIEEEHRRLQEECSEKKNKKSELSRVAVREQMCLDAKQREQIDSIKKEEKTKALNDMHKWQENAQRVASTIKQPKRTVKKNEVVPALRPKRTIYVDFTAREFPTPSRESRLDEENEWLRKQAEARRSAGFVSEDIRPEERNPQFLKAKGDEFLRKKKYLGAISAYSFGIKLNEKFADLYVARSEAHLALGNFSKTAQDCSKALELMKPEVPLNLRERALCIGRRGTALIQLGLLKQGISELKESLKLVPDEDFDRELNKAIEVVSRMDNADN